MAIEVRHTDDLSGIVEQLKRVGVTDDTFDTVVLFGHGHEDGFVMSSTEKILPDPDEWYRKKGMRDLVRGFRPRLLQLISCHPLVREDTFEPLTIGEGELQRRKGTAPALSVAFSVPVESGLDGEVNAFVNERDKESIEILTWLKGDDEDRTLKTVVTRYGLTASNCAKNLQEW